jgi:hypothetical protein
VLTGDLGFWRGRTQVVVVGIVPGVPGEGGAVDGVQQVTTKSGAWSLRSIASLSGRRVRTERFLATVASVDDDLIETL